MSEDIVYAFERIGTESRRRAVRLLLRRDRGHGRVQGGQGRDDLGHHRRDDKTIELHADAADRRLPVPPGDAGDGAACRKRSRAASPRPASTAATSCRSGPYMIEGSDSSDATSCDTLKPLSGFDPDTVLTLVRNPDYDPATDTPEARENLPDSFEFDDQHERRRHLQQDRGAARSRTPSPASRRRCSASTPRTRSSSSTSRRTLVTARGTSR